MAFFFKTLFKADENAEITKRLLDLLNVNVTVTTLQKEITEHPGYPSLLSISDVLTGHGIENMSLQIDVKDVEKLPVPFIAVIHEENADKDSFTVVKSVNQQMVEYYHSLDNKWEILPKEKFIAKWPSRVALLADGENGIGEKNYPQKLREETRQRLTKISLYGLLPILTIIAGVLVFISYGYAALPAVLFMLITLAGCLISGLLIWYELDEYNPVLQQICSAGKKINCSAILNSKASKIAGISWSVIGFTYFLGGLLLLLFSGITNLQTLFLLSWFNALAALYILFSVYYQWRIAKQWCVLCLAVQGLLALQLIIAITANWHTAATFESILSYHMIIPVLLAYSIPFIVTSLVVPAFRSAKENKTTKNELQRLKHNTQIFDALLAKQKHIPEEPDGLGIMLGNANATYKIIKVCSPYCGPCAKAHAPIEALLANNSDLQVQIIFTATNEVNDIKAPPVKHLLAIAETSNHNEETIRHALDDWYFADKKDYKVFAEKYPMNGELKQQDEKVTAMRDWCEKADIKFTPTFFVNGYQLPDIYTINDLKYFLSV